MTTERMIAFVTTAFIVCSVIAYSSAQYYGGQPPPQQQQPYTPQRQQNQQQNSEAWRRWYYQQRQQQQAGYSSGRGRQAPPPVASPAARSGYYSQRQSSSPQYQQYYQQQQQQYPPRQPSYGQPQQPAYNYQQPGANYQPPPPITPAPTTPAVPVEVEFEMEVPTTTTTTRPRSGYNQWGQYSQNYGSGGQYNSRYQSGQPSSYQQSQYQPPPPASQSSGYSNYYQPPPQQQAPPQQPPTPSEKPPQPQYSQNSWSQPPQQSSFGGQQPPPAVDPADPFSTKFDMNGLKPTVFNPQYQNQPPPQPTAASEFAGIFSDVNNQRQNPNAPSGKVDFSAKGPNPIQLNQFLAQPTATKDTNALDALLGTLLSGTVAAQGGQQLSSKSTQMTTTKTPARASVLVSDRLNDFVLGPSAGHRNNMFNEIPVNNAAYDSLNPLAGFMGETPPPPVTTTPLPPGRNGDFLEGFIGVNRAFQPSKPARESYQPNIYIYNPVNDAPAPTTPAPTPPQQVNDQALTNMGTQDLSALVQKLLGVLAVKEGAGQG